MAVNGEGVYGTRGGPFLPNDKYASTHVGQVIYLHVMDKSAIEIKLPLPQGVKATRVSLLGGKSVSYDNRQGELLIRVPEDMKDTPAYVLKIKINRQASLLDPVEIK
jgi:alpha-L-fucosidase